MNEILDGFFDGFVYLVGAYLNKKVGIVALFSLVMRFIRKFVSNLTNPSRRQNGLTGEVSHQW
jgi:hypothetical protein